MTFVTSASAAIPLAQRWPIDGATAGARLSLRPACKGTPSYTPDIASSRRQVGATWQVYARGRSGDMSGSAPLVAFSYVVSLVRLVAASG
jgi:hypothetical protein